MVDEMNTQKVPAITAQNICYHYQEGTQALTCVNFMVMKGEFVALLASNGSGKTTLLKTLIGLLKPQKGTVRIYGDDIRTMKMNELCRKIGFVLQNPNDQLFAATVKDDVAYGPSNIDLGDDEVDKRVDEALAMVSAGHLANKAIHHISHGEQKRVAIAGVLAMKPEILILDEPTAGLDPSGETAMMELLAKLNRELGITVILATHSVDMLPVFADRIFVLKNGELLREGPPRDIFRDTGLIEEAHLRLPYISSLLYEMENLDGVPIGNLPLTIREARMRLLELIPGDILKERIKGTG
jgi:cobalt/nickel transport system ATP-binding protein